MPHDDPLARQPSNDPAAHGQGRAAAARLVLASTSIYRRMLLERLTSRFEVIAPRVDEAALPGERPAALALRLARAKAMAVAAARPGDWIVGSDQTATLDGVTAIGKPGSREPARAQLRAASGRTMHFHTAVALACAARGFERFACVDTAVRFRALDDATIDAYLDREQPWDCAGSAKVESLGIALLEAVESPDPTAIVGLPLIALTTLLAEAGIPVLPP